MSAEVRILIDPVARRWQVASRDADGLTVPVPTGDPGIAVARDAAGHIVEIVIDAVVPGPGALELIASAFGSSVAQAVASADPSVEAELWVTTDRAALPVPARTGIADTADQRWDVTLGNTPAQAQRHAGMLRLVLDTMVAPALWIRVSSASTGSLLAVMPVRTVALTGDTVAECTFALDIDASQLRFDLVDDPLAPVIDAHHETRARIDMLLDDAARQGRRRPGRGAVIADTAHALALSIGDDERSRTANSLATRLRRIRRRRAALVALAGVVAVTITAVVVRAVTPEQSGLSVPADPGPMTVTFADGTEITASVVGQPPVVAPGDVWMVGMQVTTRAIGVFATADESADAAEVRCRAGDPVSMTTGALTAQPFEARLDPIDGSSSEGFVLGVVPMNSAAAGVIPIPGTCGDITQLDGDWVAEYALRRAGQTAGFDIPADLPPGTWELSLSIADTSVTSHTGTVRLRVVPPAD